VLAALAALAEAAFGEGCGIVRLDVGRDTAARSRFSGSTRPLGPEPPVWSAVTAPFPHAGPGPAPGAKLADAALTARARDFAAAAAADEALLFDSEGHLVEAARSNVFVVDADGRLLAPGPSRGAVAGIAREILCEQLAASSSLAAEGTDEDLDQEDLRRAREIIAVNAVRGVRPIVSLDGATVATGSPGPWAARLAALLARHEPPSRAR
jgi:branched-subunit amino acid aminotransferase/4-amino-4-deoxychorismate lyase